MRSIDTWLDRFCYKNPRLGIPDLMKYVVIGNIVVYLLDMFSGYACSAMLAFIPAGILRGQIWRLVSFIFVPPTGYGAIGLALFLYMYYMIGNMLEREWGTTKFTLYYGIGVAANIVVGLVLTLIYGPNHPYAVVDITYLNMSLFLAFAALYPDLRFLLFFIIPVKAKWLAWIDLAFFALSILSSLLRFYWVGVIVPNVCGRYFGGGTERHVRRSAWRSCRHAHADEAPEGTEALILCLIMIDANG